MNCAPSLSNAHRLYGALAGAGASCHRRQRYSWRSPGVELRVLAPAKAAPTPRGRRTGTRLFLSTDGRGTRAADDSVKTLFPNPGPGQAHNPHNARTGKNNTNHGQCSSAPGPQHRHRRNKPRTPPKTNKAPATRHPQQTARQPSARPTSITPHANHPARSPRKTTDAREREDARKSFFGGGSGRIHRKIAQRA